MDPEAQFSHWFPRVLGLLTLLLLSLSVMIGALLLWGSNGLIALMASGMLFCLIVGIPLQRYYDSRR